MSAQGCSVTGCVSPASVEVRLYDVYVHGDEAEIFDEQDYTCPYLCSAHAAENEQGAIGARVPRGRVKYPYSNRHYAQGFTIYRNLF